MADTDPVEPRRDARRDVRAECNGDPDVRLTDGGFRGLVEHIPAISYITDFAPGFPLSYLSPQIERILGYPVQAFLDDQELWYRIVHPDDVEPMRAGERRSLDTGEAIELEFRMFAADGRMVWFQELQTVVPDRVGHSRGSRRGCSSTSPRAAGPTRRCAPSATAPSATSTWRARCSSSSASRAGSS